MATPDSPIQPDEQIKPLTAVLIVFLSNFCVLVLELVAGRLLAPTIGVNLYTWTSVIGVILAGISLGNYLGGRFADRYASRRTLALAFLLSAFASLTILWVVDIIGAPRINIPVIAWVLLTVTAVFLLPSTLLGTISPIIVKLTLTDLKQTGNVVGRIYAAGAAGSIIGTFATGFFLISWLGTRAIIMGVAAALLLLGLIIGLSKPKKSPLPLLLAAIIFGGLTGITYQQGKLAGPCFQETNYFCIQIHADGETGRSRLLLLDRLLHSIVDLDEPTKLVYGYEQLYGDVVTAVYPPGTTNPDTLFLGGGGYVFPRFVEANFPHSQIDVVEIDPAVTELNYTELALSQATRIVSYNEDARQFFNRIDTDRQYEIIFGDTFNDVSVPYHLTTLEFNEMVAQHLADDGLYLINVIDGRHLQFLHAYVNTLRQTFPTIYVSPTGIEPGTSSRQTFVIVATRGNTAVNKLFTAPPLADQFLSLSQLEAYWPQDTPLLLTDDFVPVDNLLESVLRESGY